MQRAAIAGLAVALVAIAGCTGSFNVKQTEPIRVQLEGSGASAAPQTVSVASGGEQDVDVDTAGAQHVTFDLDVKPATTPTTVVVKVVDKDTDDVLAQKQVPAPTTTQGPQSQTIDVDIHGSHNVVFILAAQGGDVVVDVSAHGTGNVTTSGTDTGSMTGTGSSTLTGEPTDTGSMTSSGMTSSAATNSTGY